MSHQYNHKKLSEQLFLWWLITILLSKHSIRNTVQTMWNKKQKRAYHRAKSGVKVSTILHLPIKHMVLTTSPGAVTRNISNDYQTLRKRIFRKFNVLLPYFMVHTNEGYGVLHVLYRSKLYIPQPWLSKQWTEIHRSPYVYIKEIQDNDIARYVVTQYVASQGTSYQRCSWSQNWVSKGFVKEWKRMIKWAREWKISFNELLSRWNKFLISIAIKQVLITDYLPP